jgi:3-hydroxyisobutyrate dehydrogenase-like beta-hydroxyacid dehydrogenase
MAVLCVGIFDAQISGESPMIAAGRTAIVVGG